MRKNQFEEIDTLKNFSVEYIDEENFIISKKNKLYQYKSDQSIQLIGEVPIPLWKKACIQIRLGQRLLRSIFYNVLPINEELFFVSFGKQIGVIKGNKYKSIKGVRQPSRILRDGVVKKQNGDIFWGEYIQNPDRKDVIIYRWNRYKELAEERYKFSPKEIRHVHGLYMDPYVKNEIYCVTGDKPSECQILKTKNDFKTLEKLWFGDETWRTVSLQFTKEAIYYASDAEFEQNCIYKISRKSNKRTILAKIDGPVYYSTRVKDKLFFGVTAELCPSQVGNYASIWEVDINTDTTNKIFSIEKDFTSSKRIYTKTPLLSKLFMNGTFHFPITNNFILDYTYISIVGLKKMDNKVLKVGPKQ